MRFARILTLALLLAGTAFLACPAGARSIDTGFRPAVNGFVFPNEGDPAFLGPGLSLMMGQTVHDEMLSHTGHCYGMARACTDDFLAGVETINLSQERAMPRIDDLQTRQTLFYACEYLTPPFGFPALDNAREYGRLVERLAAGSPAVIGLYSSDKSHTGHSVVAYRVDEIGDQALIYLYDPNLPATANDYDACPMIAIYDLQKGTFTYDNGQVYDEFALNEIDGLSATCVRMITVWLGLISVAFSLALPLLQ